MTALSIGSVEIGARHRRDLGDVDALARSIETVGLLHPIVVTPSNVLIAGERRLEACKRLGWVEVPVTIVDLAEIVKGEFAENADRKDFLPSEIEAITAALTPLERVAAKERQREGGGDQVNDRVAKVSQPARTTDKIGAFAGVSGRTVEKIHKVHEAAKADPERFGQLVEEMDRTGKVDPAYAKVRRQERHTKIAERASKIAVPDTIGPFAVLYADPPWKWGHFGDLDNENEAGKGRTPDQHYETLTYDQIKSFCVGKYPVPDIAHKDAALFLWCTSANIVSALEVMQAWGFAYKAQAVWVKFKDGHAQTGTGLVFRNAHEVLLYGTRGDMPGPQHQPQSAFLFPRGRHSAKPPEIRTAIEKMYPDFDEHNRAELFAREHVPGWSCYGHESK